MLDISNDISEKESNSQNSGYKRLDKIATTPWIDIKQIRH